MDGYLEHATERRDKPQQQQESRVLFCCSRSRVGAPVHNPENPPSPLELDQSDDASLSSSSGFTIICLTILLVVATYPAAALRP